MQEENLLKMAKMATPPIMDSHMANILLCYLLYRIDRPVQVSQLYDIAVGSNIINYFAYQESISYLTEHGSVQLRRMPEGVEEYVCEAISPINCEGDVIGAVVLLGQSKTPSMGEVERKLIQSASGFLGRQMGQ